MKVATFGVLLGATALGTCTVILDGVYIVDEGNAAVITHWGKAVAQEGPDGIRFKYPLKTGVREFDVRERRAGVDISAATANQLPISASVSINWRMDPQRVMEVYVNYGSPEQFATNILGPRLQQAAKAGISKYQASDLIRDRTAAAETILTSLRGALETYPVALASLQIENVTLPPRYLEAVMAKEEARENASREQYNLEKQKLEAQREVQTAVADRDAAKARAEGEAFAIREKAKADADATRLRGEAEAAAIRAVEVALSENPLLVEYERAKRWNGKLPETVLGGETGVIMGLK